MKRFLVLSVFFSVLALSQTIAAQTNFKTYSNARFGYSISYPANLLKPQGESDNGDGQGFRGNGATLIVYGTNFTVSDSFQKDFDLSVKDYGEKNVTYKLFRKDFYVISGKRGGKIMYHKTIKKLDGTYASFVLEYDESKRRIFDRLVPIISKSFK